MSDFKTWFTEQFGSRRSTHRSSSDGQLVDELRGHMIELGRIDAELSRRQLWDHDHKAALYAWNAARDQASQE